MGLHLGRIGRLIYGLRNRGHGSGRDKWPAATIGRILNRTRSWTELDGLSVELKGSMRPALEGNPGADEKRLQLAELAIIGLIVAEPEHAIRHLAGVQKILG